MLAVKQKKILRQADVTSICDAAQAAWDAAKPTARKVIFDWEGHRYQSRLTNMRMLVETLSGDPIAARYH